MTYYFEKVNEFSWHPLILRLLSLVSRYIYCVEEIYKDDKQKQQLMFEFYDFFVWRDTVLNYYLQPDILKKNKGKLPEVITVFNFLKVNQWKDKRGHTLAIFHYDRIENIMKASYDLCDFDREFFLANFFEVYDGLYSECRSVVVDLNTFEIIICPQTKFKNINQSEEYSEVRIRGMLESTTNYEWFITDKMDGSNINFSYNNEADTIYCASSMNINPKNSWRLQEAKKIFDSRPEYRIMLEHYPNCTFMFEFISSKDAHLVNYSAKQERLYLFGIRNNLGPEVNLRIAENCAKSFNVPFVKRYTEETFDSILQQISGVYNCNEKEGWVLSIYNKNNYYYSPSNPSNVFKVKIKVEDWVKINRIINSKLSTNYIIRQIANGADLEEFYHRIPKNYRTQFDYVCYTIMNYIKNMGRLVMKEYNQCLHYAETQMILKHIDIECVTPEAIAQYNSLKRKYFMIKTTEECSKETAGRVRCFYDRVWGVQGYDREEKLELSLLYTDRGNAERKYKKFYEIENWLEANKGQKWFQNIMSIDWERKNYG